MKQVVKTTQKASQFDKYRTAVLRMELDYELATLYEAITEDDNRKKVKCKSKLEKIRKELIRLQAL